MSTVQNEKFQRMDGWILFFKLVQARISMSVIYNERRPCYTLDSALFNQINHPIFTIHKLQSSTGSEENDG